MAIGARPDDSRNQGDPYERYVGRRNRLVARQFLDGLDLPPPDSDGSIPLVARAWAIQARVFA
jgi:hypothetical protein